MEVKFKSPGNIWPKDSRLKTIGACQLQSVNAIYNSLGGFIKAMGIPQETADNLLPKLMLEMQDTNIHLWWPM